MWLTSNNDLRRSRRFPIEAPLRYRVYGEPAWLTGTTENISSAGVLFRSERLLERTVRVEVHFVLFASDGKQLGLEVACKGEVVRLELPLNEEELPAVAVKISDYRLRPWSRGQWSLEATFTGSDTED